MQTHPLIDLAVNSLVTFFVIIDPLGLIPIFNSLAHGMTAAERRTLAYRGVGIGSGILLLFALGGERLLDALDISLPAFRAAGGVMLFIIAAEMVFQSRTERRAQSADKAADETAIDDVSIFPLAIPLLAGPGAITSALLLSSRYRGAPIEQGIVLAAMLLVMLVTLATFLTAERLGRIIGPTVAQVATRLLGILLAAVAVEYIVGGVHQMWTAGP